MEIRARPTSLTAMPLRAHGVISSRMRWKDHFSISSVSLADLGGKTDRVCHCDKTHETAHLTAASTTRPETLFDPYLRCVTAFLQD